MEYTKQAWTAPTGTGLSRYAKSAESASHVTLTLDPVNLTNSPTPFTMARMAHMEEGIAKAYDTAPPTPWAQYSGKDIPMLPDNLAGTTDKRDNDWTTNDGWMPGHTSIVLSVEDNTLKMVYDGTRLNIGLSLSKAGLAYNNKFIVGKIKSTVPIISVSYYNGIDVTPLKLNKTNSYETVFYGYSTSTSPQLTLYINYSQLTAKTCWLESLYVGDGSYDRLVFDNSYHYRHLRNNAVVPTPRGLYFNGTTSYLRSKDKVTLPDVFTFSATVNCASSSTAQRFFTQGTPPIPFLLVFRTSNTDNLVIQVSNGTVAINAFTANNFFTGLDNTDIKIELSVDFINKTIKVYRNNIQFGSVVSTPTMLKPVTDNIYFGNDASIGYPLFGYMRNIYLYDTALTDTQRNWLAQGNTPPILYDVTNYELEQGVAPITEGVETIRRDEDFTMNTYADGKKLRIANTDDAQITCTLPSGQTMNGQTSFTIAPDTLLEFELIGTSWKCVSKEWEILWENPAKASSFVSQLVTLSAIKEQFKRLVFTYGAFSGGDGYSNVHTKEIQTSTTSTCLFYLEWIAGQPNTKRTREVFNITGNTLNFQHAFTTVQNNSAIIPYAIYGIK